ncbi:hypothetical protein XELAEV_18017138mg [Xenopus laevis]|uniref:Uncharacterized protein n=1 Tax=Xenopus laevis TaxID=8355 RepID=A0A974DCL5_XENLA|nr:hypothetical protein XELAEV_18017138mg [Xenopus laevis]
MFITSYSKQYYEIKRIVKKYLPILNGDDKLQTVLQHGCKFVVCCAKTLGNILSPSDVTVTRNARTWLNTTGSFSCGATRCIYTRKVYKIRNGINCNTLFVIYLLTCLKCNIQYVGCTSRKLKCCMKEHIIQIVSRNLGSVVSRHFSDCSN